MNAKLPNIMGCISVKGVSEKSRLRRKDRKGSFDGAKNRKSLASDVMELSSEEEALFTAISFGKIHRIVSLLEKVDNLGIRDANHETPLVRASYAMQGDQCSHVSRMLLKLPTCDINAKNRWGRTALMYAAMDRGKTDVVRILARNKWCDTNIMDEDGYTGLMHAVSNDNPEAVEVLLFCPRVACKVDVNMHNLEGSTATDIAVTRGNKECCQMLVSRAKADVSQVHDLAKLNSLLGKT